MVTQKQLAALARGRAIRAANLRNGYTHRRTRKGTNISLGAGLGLAGAGLLLYNALKTFLRVKAIITVSSWVGKGLKYLFTNNYELNTTKMKEITNKMKSELKAKGIEDEKLFKDIDKVNASVDTIDMLAENKKTKEQQYQTAYVMQKFNKILLRYNELNK